MKARIPSADSAAYNSSVLNRFKNIIKAFKDDPGATKCAYGNTMYALKPKVQSDYCKLIKDSIQDAYSPDELSLRALAFYNALKVALLLPYAFPANDDLSIEYGTGEYENNELNEFVHILSHELFKALLDGGLEMDFELDYVFQYVAPLTGFYNHVLTTIVPFANVEPITRHYYYSQIGTAVGAIYNLTNISEKSPRAYRTLFSALAALDSLNPPTKLLEEQLEWARSCKMLECYDSSISAIIGKDGFRRITEMSDSPNVWSFNKRFSELTKREKAVLLCDDEGATIPVKLVNEVANKADSLYTEVVTAIRSGVTACNRALADVIPILRERRADAVATSIANMFSNGSSQHGEVLSLKRTIRKLEDQLAEAQKAQPKEIVRTEQVEVSDKRDRELIETLRAKNAKLEERVKSLNADLESLYVVQQDNDDLVRRNAELDKLVEDLAALIPTPEETEQEVEDFTLEERAILSTLKVHIDMPDCASVKIIKSLMPSAKIDTDNLGAHGNVNLTPGYSIYCFCTKLSHSHFTSFSNQVNASGYVKCFANTCSAMSICKAILKTYKENNSHAD